MSPLLKKQELQGIVEYLVGSLGNDENLEDYVQSVLNYQAELQNADALTAEEQEALQTAKEYIETQRIALVGSGMFTESAFSAIKADESGGTLAQCLADVQKYTGSTEVRRNIIKADRIPMLLGGIAIPLVIVNGTARYGVKSTKSGKKSANADRPNLKNLQIGMKHAKFWKHNGKYYEILRSPSGFRVFDLNTREELTDAENLPETASGAQKLATGGWADAFRLYNDQLPSEWGLKPLEAHEIS